VKNPGLRLRRPRLPLREVACALEDLRNSAEATASDLFEIFRVPCVLIFECIAYLEL
jgi:hypothetical protein